MAKVCDPLRKCTSTKFQWVSNNTYQNLYNRAKSIIKNSETVAFYNEKEQLYQEIDRVGVGIEARLLQVKGRMQLPRNGSPDHQVCVHYE